MWNRDRACAVVAGFLLSATGLVVGCSDTTGGKPVAVPPASPPSSSAPPPSSPPSSPPPSIPPGAQTLSPTPQGYVYIETKSGKTRCQLSSSAVGCEAEFLNSPSVDGEPANGVSVTPEGNLQWIVGNLGDIPTVTIDYRSYEAVGWTISADASGTVFTNNRTGHGMFVSLEKVSPF